MDPDGHTGDPVFDDTLRQGLIVQLRQSPFLSLVSDDRIRRTLRLMKQAQAARKEDVLAALSQMASRFKTRVGESLATIERHSMPLAEATTASLDAWKANSTAIKAGDSVGVTARVVVRSRTHGRNTADCRDGATDAST